MDTHPPPIEELLRSIKEATEKKEQEKMQFMKQLTEYNEHDFTDEEEQTSEEDKKARKFKILPNGKLTKGRVKIDMGYILDKNRRLCSFSKRKAGLFKKVRELEQLTGSPCLMLLASETGHIYSYVSKCFESFIKEPPARQFILQCLSQNASTSDRPKMYYDFAPMNSNSVRSKPKKQEAKILPAMDAFTAHDIIAQTVQEIYTETMAKVDVQAIVAMTAQDVLNEAMTKANTEIPETEESDESENDHDSVIGNLEELLNKPRKLVTVKKTWFPPAE